jgi:hypothetical protein
VFELGQQQKNGYYSLTASSYDNPFLTMQEIENLKAAARLEGDDSTVEEEIYARWLSDQGAVFSNLRTTFSVPVLSTHRWTGFDFVLEPASERPSLWLGENVDTGNALRFPDRYIAGLDFGLKDATVWSCFNIRTRHQACLARFSGNLDYTEIIPAIDKLMDWWNDPTVVYDEGGGHGGAIREYLARRYRQGVSGRKWSFQSKSADITRAQFLCSEAGTDKGWALIDTPWQRSEFASYEVTIVTKSGERLSRPRYSAPAGRNDDSVTAACLAATMLSAEHHTHMKKQEPARGTHDWWTAYLKQFRSVKGLGRRQDFRP